MVQPIFLHKCQHSCTVQASSDGPLSSLSMHTDGVVHTGEQLVSWCQVGDPALMKTPLGCVGGLTLLLSGSPAALRLPAGPTSPVPAVQHWVSSNGECVLLWSLCSRGRRPSYSMCLKRTSFWAMTMGTKLPPNPLSLLNPVHSDVLLLGLYIRMHHGRFCRLY